MGDLEGRFGGEVASIVGLDRNTGIGEGSVDVVEDEVCVFQVTCLQELNTQHSFKGQMVSLSCIGNMVCRRGRTPT